MKELLNLWISKYVHYINFTLGLIGCILLYFDVLGQFKLNWWLFVIWNLPLGGLGLYSLYKNKKRKTR